MFVRDLQIMLPRHRLGVADPRADNMLGPLLGEFSLAGAAEILREFGPGFEPRLGNDPLKLGPQVAGA